MRGIVLLGEDDKQLRQEATRRGLGLAVSSERTLAFERTLFVGPRAAVPWALVDAGFAFLERWEAAAPLAAGGELAETVGGPGERERTRLLLRDLRLPLYETDLVFVRDCEAGRALLAAWREEEGDERLGFLRALYRMKPLILALPRSWLQQAARMAATPVRVSSGTKLIHVEIAPGRSVCCRPEEAEMYRERFAALRTGRRV